MMIYVYMWSHTLKYIQFIVSVGSTNIDVSAHKLLNCTYCGEFIPFFICYTLSIISCIYTVIYNAHH